MPYIFRGNLRAYLCDECQEPLRGVIVRLYRADREALPDPAPDRDPVLLDARQAEGSECQREIAASLIDTRKYQAKHRLATAHAARQRKTPDRRFKKRGQPRLAHQRAASSQH